MSAPTGSAGSEPESVSQHAAQSITHPLARTLLVLTFGGTGRGTTRRSAAVLAMLAGALVGALLLKRSLVLPLAVASALALLTAIL
jgi:hypothetical protein